MKFTAKFVSFRSVLKRREFLRGGGAKNTRFIRLDFSEMVITQKCSKIIHHKRHDVYQFNSCNLVCF